MEYNLIEIDQFGFDPEKIKGYVVDEEIDEEGEIIKRLIVLYDGHMITIKDEEDRLIKFLRKNLKVKIIGNDSEVLTDDDENKKVSLRSTTRRPKWEN